MFMYNDEIVLVFFFMLMNNDESYGLLRQAGQRMQRGPARKLHQLPPRSLRAPQNGGHKMAARRFQHFRASATTG